MTDTNDMDNGPVTGTDDTPITLDYTEVTVISDDLDAQQAAIDQTRGSIGETLDAIKDKLDPHLLMTEAKDAAANVMDKAKDTVHEVVSDVASHAKETAKEAVGGVVDEAKEVVGGAVDTVKGAGSTVIEIVKKNPMPAALIGIGGLWLYLLHRDQQAGARQSGYTGRAGYDPYRQNGDQGGIRETLSEAGDRIGDMAGQVREKAGQAAEVVGEKMGAAREKVTEVASSTMDSAKDLGESIVEMVKENPIPAALAGAGITWLILNQTTKSTSASRNQSGATYRDPSGHVRYRQQPGGQASGMGGWVADKATDVKEKASEWGSQAWEATSNSVTSATSSLQRSFQENPIPIGVAAIGLGAALGLLIPRTERENQLMGETRDRLVDTATDKVQDVAHKVQRVAEETLDTARETAREHARNEGLTTG